MKGRDVLLGLSLTCGLCSFELFAEEVRKLIKRESSFYLEEGKEVLHGLTTETSELGILLRGEYVSGQKEGEWEHWHANAEPWRKEGWLGGLQHGQWMEWTRSGNLLSQSSYHKGLKDGLEEQWFSHGQRRLLCHWDQGDLHGAYQEWHHGGQEKIRCRYQYGEIEGLYREWNERGELIREDVYQAGQVRKIQLYHEKYNNGHMKLSYSYYLDENRQEVRHGTMNKWFPNGETWLKCNYVHGKLDGLWQYGKLDGLNCRQEQYSMGVKDGPSREFHLGELIKEEIWKDGVLIHKKEL